MNARLSDGQREVLVLLARWEVQRDGALSGPEVSRVLRKSPDGWSRGKLIALEKRGLVFRLGSTLSGGQCWNISPAGRAAIADHTRAGDAS